MDKLLKNNTVVSSLKTDLKCGEADPVDQGHTTKHTDLIFNTILSLYNLDWTQNYGSRRITVLGLNDLFLLLNYLDYQHNNCSLFV